jgi:uncharacterized protein (TIGR02996 family)
LPTEQDLLAAVLADPNNDAPRSDYADWCLGQSDPSLQLRGRSIRLQLQIANLSGPEDAFAQYERLEEENDLKRSGAGVWNDPMAQYVFAYEFHRGFVEHVTMDAGEFLKHGADLFRSAPVRYVTVRNARPVLASLFDSPLVEPLSALSLRGTGLGDEDTAAIAESPRLKNLWWLDLSQNEIGFEGVKTLAASKALPHVTFLSLKNNPCDPAESIGMEGTAIMDTSLPEEGKTLEALYRHIPWLHCNTDTLLEYPPSPFRRN